MDSVKIKILADGTIRVETDKVSAPNHLNAEQFLAEMSRLAGGSTDITHKHGTLGHHHHHGNEQGEHHHH